MIWCVKEFALMSNTLQAILIDGFENGRPLPALEERRELAKIKAELKLADCRSEDDIVSAAREATAVLTYGGQITRRVLAGLPRCLVVIRYGIGYDTVDVEAATDNHILVVNIPDFCFEEVSNQAIALLLGCAKKMVFLDNLVKNGNWARAKQSQAPMGSVQGQVCGIIGCGNIGKATARKAACFGLQVLGYDPYLDPALAAEEGIRLVDLPTLLGQSDYVLLHTVLNRETRHMIGEAQLKMMKTSAYLINTARGAVIDEAALIRALNEKWIAGAGLDVFEQEPIDPGNPLLKMENVIVMPHSASFSDAAFERLRQNVGQEAVRVLSGKWPRNVVNKTCRPKVELARE
jgi:D-3-phosphoglycerate dehydrogenase / 2-oxoglutarate reductase